MTSELSEITLSVLTKRMYDGTAVGACVHNDVYYIPFGRVIHVCDCMTHDKKYEIALGASEDSYDDTVNSMRVTKDGRFLIAETLNYVHFVNITTQRSIVITESSGFFTCVDVGADKILVNGADRSLHIWNCKSGMHVQHLNTSGAYAEKSVILTYNANTETLLYAFNNDVYTQNLSHIGTTDLGAVQYHFVQCADIASSMEWICDERFVVFTHTDVSIYDTCKRHVVTKSLHKRITGMTVTPCKKYICCVFQNGDIFIYRSDTLALVRGFRYVWVETVAPCTLSFSDDGNVMYVSDLSHIIGYSIEGAFETPLLASLDFELYATQGKVKHHIRNTLNYRLFFEITCATRVDVGSAYTLRLSNGGDLPLIMQMKSDTRAWAEAIRATAAHHRRIGEDNTDKVMRKSIIHMYRTDILQYIRHCYKLRVLKHIMELIVAYTLQ